MILQTWSWCYHGHLCWLHHTGFYIGLKVNSTNCQVQSMFLFCLRTWSCKPNIFRGQIMLYRTKFLSWTFKQCDSSWFWCLISYKAVTEESYSTEILTKRIVPYMFLLMFCFGLDGVTFQRDINITVLVQYIVYMQMCEIY